MAFSDFATIEATVESPVTFTTVLSISSGLSIPKIRANPSTGSPTELNTMISITMLPPGTPGDPIEARRAVRRIIIS